MTRTLHVANGDTTVALLREAAVEGDIISGDDILMEGPLPRGLADDAAWRERAAALDGLYGITAERYLEARRQRDATLARANSIVIWTEPDLFCQTNLLYLLGVAGAADDVRVVCPPEGRLARLKARELVALERTPVPRERFDAAAATWSALCAPNPRGLEELVDGTLKVWPAMRDAIRLHLGRFPSPTSGLALLDATLLTLASDGCEFAALFSELGRLDATAGYGIGDLQATHAVRTLHDAELVLIDDPDADAGLWRVETTEEGEAALSGEDPVRAMPRRWVGGVHLSEDPMTGWRWTGERLLAPEPG